MGFEGEQDLSRLVFLLCFGNIPSKDNICNDIAECQSIRGLGLKVAVFFNLTIGKEGLVQEPLRSTPKRHRGFWLPGEVLLLN